MNILSRSGANSELSVAFCADVMQYRGNFIAINQELRAHRCAID
jgi:hypothetical protein